MNIYESDIEQDVCQRALAELRVFNVKLRGVERGWPDREFFIPGGVPLFIEFKRPGEAPTQYQRMVHARLRYAGYRVEVHDTVEGALKSIRNSMSVVPAILRSTK